MTGAAAQRLFFALWPDAPARSALARLASEVAHHGLGRAPREDGLHVTLAFLGSVEARRMDAVLAAGAHAARCVEPFVLALERVGGTSFGVAWMTPEGLPVALAMLHEALVAALEQAGFPRERRMFRPHVTLARDCVRAAHRGPLPPIAWTVDRLALVASTLSPGGSRYRDVANWPLGGDR